MLTSAPLLTYCYTNISQPRQSSPFHLVQVVYNCLLGQGGWICSRLFQSVHVSFCSKGVNCPKYPSSRRFNAWSCTIFCFRSTSSNKKNPGEIENNQLTQILQRLLLQSSIAKSISVSPSPVQLRQPIRDSMHSSTETLVSMRTLAESQAEPRPTRQLWQVYVPS